MFKFATIGAYKQVRNNPRTKAVIDVKNGYVVIPDDATGLAPTPATPTDAQGDVYVVWNIIDKPEVLNTADFVVSAGEYVRAFKLADLVDLNVELSFDVIKDDYASISVGDVLVPCDDQTDADDKGKWKVSAATGYEVSLKVLEKTTFGDKGIYAKVVLN